MSYDTLPEVPKAELGRLTSHPEFGRHTKGTEVAEAFASSIRGRNICITGVSPKSLGESLATTIAKHTPRTLILASRTSAKLEDVAKLVKDQSPNVELQVVVLDLASLEAVRKAAAEISQLVDHLDILINNAGVVSSERKETVDGIEQTFGANHIGHFLFTSLLTPLLLAGAAKSKSRGLTRVVNVTSLGYRLSPVRLYDYNFEGNLKDEQTPMTLPPHMAISKDRPYSPFLAYGQSKTANILHCVSMNQKLGTKGVKALAVHPGSIWTDLSRNLTPDDLKIIEGTATDWVTQDQGTSTILVAALDPKLAQTSQVFLANCQVENVERFANDADIAERLWQLSEKLTGESANF